MSFTNGSRPFIESTNVSLMPIAQAEPVMFQLRARRSYQLSHRRFTFLTLHLCFEFQDNIVQANMNHKATPIGGDTLLKIFFIITVIHWHE